MKKTIKIAAGILIFLFVVTGIGLLVRYIVYRNDADPYKTFLLPRISASEFHITEMDKNKTVMTVRVLVKNPMPLGFSADSISYIFLVMDTVVLRSSYPEKFSLRKNDSTWVEFPVTVYNKKLVRLLKGAEYEHADSIYYELKSVVYTRVKNFHLGVRRKLPLFRVPDIKMEKLKVDSLNLHHISLIAHMDFINPNVFPVEVIDFNYRFALEDGNWIDGGKPGLLSFPARSITAFDMPAHIEFKGMGKTFVDWIKKGKDITYRMEARYKLHSDDPKFRNSKVTLEGSGTVRAILETGKMIEKPW